MMDRNQLLMLGMLCLGVFVGAVVTRGLEFMQSTNYARAVTTILSAAVAGAVVLFIEQFDLAEGVVTYCIGLMVALLWVYTGSAVERIRSHRSSMVILGWLQLTGQVLASSIAVFLFVIPPMIRVYKQEYVSEPLTAVSSATPVRPSVRPSRHAAIIDAGSSSSRLWIFKWSTDEHGDPVVEKEVYLKGKTVAGNECPLTSMITNEQETCACLNSLLVQGRQQLATAGEESAAGRIPLWVKATGGVRKASMTGQIDILTKTNRCLESSANYAWRGAEAIAGPTEALYAWLAVNYVHKTLQPNAATYGIAEIGGESAQIAFRVPMPVAPTLRGSVVAVPLSFGSVHIYSHSDVLGKEAAVRALGIASTRECGLDGVVASCLAAIDKFLCAQTYAGIPCSHRGPEFPLDDIKFIGLSNFKHVVTNSGMDSGSLLDVQNRAMTMCGTGTEKAALRQRFIRPLPDEFRRAVCLDALYTTRLAEYAWGLPLTAVAPANVALDSDWPLGAMFLEIARRSDRNML